MDRIKFSNKTMTYWVKNKAEKRRCYNVVRREKRGEFDILNDISDHMTLVQLIDTAGNINHVTSITVYWIFYYN